MKKFIPFLLMCSLAFCDEPLKDEPVGSGAQKGTRSAVSTAAGIAGITLATALGVTIAVLTHKDHSKGKNKGVSGSFSHAN